MPTPQNTEHTVASLSPFDFIKVKQIRIIIVIFYYLFEGIINLEEIAKNIFFIEN